MHIIFEFPRYIDAEYVKKICCVSKALRSIYASIVTILYKYTIQNNTHKKTRNKGGRQKLDVIHNCTVYGNRELIFHIRRLTIQLDTAVCGRLVQLMLPIRTSLSQTQQCGSRKLEYYILRELQKAKDCNVGERNRMLYRGELIGRHCNTLLGKSHDEVIIYWCIHLIVHSVFLSIKGIFQLLTFIIF